MDFQENNNSQQSDDLTKKLVSGAMSFASAVPTTRYNFPIYRPRTQTAGSTPSTTYPGLNTSLKNLGQLTTNYGESTKYEKFHPGIDVANKIGTPIPSVSQGVVERVENNKTGFGNSVIIKDPQGNELRYSHLKQAYVRPGQTIAKGGEVGEMGNTGSTYSNSGGTGSHLDLRIMNAYKKYINPFTYLNKKG